MVNSVGLIVSMAEDPVLEVMTALTVTSEMFDTSILYVTPSPTNNSSDIAPGDAIKAGASSSLITHPISLKKPRVISPMSWLASALPTCGVINEFGSPAGYATSSQWAMLDPP